MSMWVLLMAYTIIAGFCGLSARLYVASFLLSTESISDRNIFRRYVYRYLIFSSYYLISFLVTPALIAPFAEQLNSNEITANKYFYFILCIPAALVLFALDWKLIVWGDKRKIVAREILRRKK